jgi:glycosyltransferase involved in cell wall biosynthesis
MACSNHWQSSFQVGSHALARAFVRAGWQVAFLSDPISPLHLCQGLTTDLSRRLANYWQDGVHDCGGRLWTYAPASLFTPHNKPFLRSARVHRNWQHWTCPNVADRVRRQGFGHVDLLYIDSSRQAFWLDALEYDQAVYRLTDYSPSFSTYTRATRVLEEEIARRVDLLVYPSPELREYAEALGPRRTLHLPNGVEFEHFATPQPRPPEYRGLGGPIAVYVGVIEPWFHFDWLRRAAQRLPEMSFVLIGPDRLARRELDGLANVHLLGCRNYRVVPAYLQHASVGMMPFDEARGGATVACLNPLKLYQYLASGIPVVSSRWRALEALEIPAERCATAEEFVSALRLRAAEPGDVDGYRLYAAACDWGRRLHDVLDALQFELATG